MYASFQHMLDTDVEHDVRYYWDTHMYSSFMVDPLGLDLIDQIGVDRVMWSSDFPHNESTFGYSERSLAAVVDAVGPEQARADRQRQRARLPRLCEADAPTVTVIADVPDLRPHAARPTGPSCARSMADQGVDALVLLGNSNVSYATGCQLAAGRLRAGQRGAAGRRGAWPTTGPAPVHRRSASGAARRRSCPTDHLHGPGVPGVRRGRRGLRRPAGRAGAGRRAGGRRRAPRGHAARRQRLFPGGLPASADDVIGAAKLIKTADELAFLRRALRITEQAIADVQAALAPGVRQVDLTGRLPRAALRARRRRQHPRPDLAGDAGPPGRRPLDHPRRHRLPAADHRARAGPRRRAVGRHRHQLRRVLLGLRPHLGGRRRIRRPRQQAQFRAWRRDRRRRPRGHPGRGHRRRPDPGGASAACDGDRPVDGALLPRARARASTAPSRRSSAPTWATPTTSARSSRPAPSSCSSRSSGTTGPAATAPRR